MQGGQSYYTTVPCGHCAECLKAKRDGIVYRSYYEAQNVFKSGGYVLFDTLTFDEEHLPRVSSVINFKDFSKKFPFGFSNVFETCNYPCFDRVMIQRFFKRLRRKLDYHGFKGKDCFKYLVATEYGDDDNYTHRPHVHVLFYVTDPSLSPLVLSHLIALCWKAGRTQGIDYKPSHFVMDYVFGDGFVSDRSALVKQLTYVSKYVTKDSDFQSELEFRVNDLMESLFSPEWCESQGIEYSPRCWYSRIIDGSGFTSYDAEGLPHQLLSVKDIRDIERYIWKFCGMFTLQSKEFGADFLSYNDKDDVIRTGQIAMPDPDRIVRYIPLPQYYQKRIFYDLQRDFNGHLFMALNEDGKQFKLNGLDRNRKNLFLKLTSWRDNMLNHDYYCPDSDSDWYDRLIGRFNDLNHGRSLQLFADYLLYYKGRLKSPEQVERENRGIYCVDFLDDFVGRFYASYDENSDVLYNYCTPTDREHGLNMITSEWIGDAESWKSDGFPLFAAGHVLSNLPWQFECEYVINDSSDPSFAGYDEMFDIYCRSQVYRSEFRQDCFDSKESVHKRLKKVFKVR